jgi:mono/diheme cytochrome c family protein
MFLPRVLSCTKLLVLGSLLIAFAALASVTASVAMAQDKVVKKAPVGQSDPSFGKATYTSYCAPCHGTSGEGDGPAANEFKVPPADLTQLTKKNHGEFPSSHLWAMLQFGAPAPAHGSSDMPV